MFGIRSFFQIFFFSFSQKTIDAFGKESASWQYAPFCCTLGAVCSLQLELVFKELLLLFPPWLCSRKQNKGTMLVLFLFLVLIFWISIGTITFWSLFSIFRRLSFLIHPSQLFLEQVLAGSYFSVAGGLVGMLKPGRMSMFGTLLVIWGLVKEGILGKPVNTDPTKAVFVYPTMLFALMCAFLSVRYDVKKVARITSAQSIAKPLKGSSKSKLK